MNLSQAGKVTQNILTMKLLAPLVLFAAVAAASGQCNICPDGPEFPDADPIGGNFYSCSDIPSL